jgi:hypothetical protein
VLRFARGSLGSFYTAIVRRPLKEQFYRAS